MPIDLDMILSQSPPLFSAAAFMDFRYRPFEIQQDGRTRLHNAFNGYHHQEARSCLMAKADDPKGNKKRVWFADDKGLALTHVKIMSEPSNCPPKWTDEFLAQVTKGVKSKPTFESHWVPQFAQPASDYIEFRNKVQKNCVSLENVITKESDSNVTGTIKVKNITFDKDVFIRITFDRWLTSEDVPATFVPSGVEAGSSMFDTFSFAVAIPQSATKFETVEFCVCYKCSGTEYWDNNGGENYKLSVANKVSKKETPAITANNEKQYNDALQVNLDSWSEFASWSHLITDGPYW